MQSGKVLLAAGAGVVVGVCAEALRRRWKSARGPYDASPWGWFSGPPLPFPPDGSPPITLLISEGKVPVENGGGIIWFASEQIRIDPGKAPAQVPVGDERGSAVAVDVHVDAAEKLLTTCNKNFKWLAPRALLSLTPSGRASVAEVQAVVRAVSLLAWHRASAFSGADGSPTAFVPDARGRRRKLASGRSLYPRVDPVAIVLVESADGDKVLLGRQAGYPKGLFTCISGFVEHGESAESAAAREVLEETAVVCGEARLVASQPWPCGRGNHCELMLGVTARATPGGEAIDTRAHAGAGGGELEAARWFTREQVGEMLRNQPIQADGSRRVPADGELAVPPAFAIAHALIWRWHAGVLPSRL